MTARTQEQAATAASARPPSGEPEPLRPERASTGYFPWLVLALILLATLAAYSPVFFNFFNGDDFVHLVWLKQAVKQPELIWRNFHSAWLDGTTARFYRPLISVFMVSDYLVWGVNGLGFRLTNLTCHVISTLFLFLILRDLAGSGAGGRSAGRVTWALGAAALFALYPLHPEAVSWITGRVDSVVTVFYVGSLWFYMRWRQAASPAWLVVSLVAMTLGLLSKEMAVTLPPAFLFYELLVGPGPNAGIAAPGRAAQQAGTGSRRPAIGALWRAVKPTLPFWALLGVYFGVRRLALGTFVGGYDDSLFFVSNWKSFILGWLHGLRMMLVPINKDFLGAHHILTKTWETCVVLCFLLGACTLFKESGLRRPVAFLAVWFFLSLVPVYKIFAIGDDLQASRLAYLATVPLCALLSVALAGWTSARLADGHRGTPGGTFQAEFVGRAVSVTLALTMSGCAGVLLWVNNQAWASAGQESNAIREALGHLYRRVPGDPQVLLIGLPDHIHGAYTCRNAIWGMTRSPQLHRDIENCLMVNPVEPILPFGFLKTSLKQHSDRVLIFRWAGKKEGFVPVTLADGDDELAAFGLDRNRLQAGLEPVSRPGCRYVRHADGALEVWGGKGFRGRPELRLDLPGLSCWPVDFLAIEVALPEPQSYSSVSGVDILYANDIVQQFELGKRAHADIKPAVAEQTLLFPFRSLPEWALGGKCGGLKILLPDDTHLTVKSVRIVPASQVMPSIAFENGGYLGTKGFIHLSSAQPDCKIFIDAGSVRGAAGAILEITRPNLLFESQNSQQESALVMKTISLPATRGTMLLKRQMFPAAVMYEIRSWAVDAGGRRVGAAGDHLVVSVEP
jgi:hypothetical protein